MIDWSKMWQAPQTPPPPEPPKQKPLPTFKDRPRTYEWRGGKMVVKDD